MRYFTMRDKKSEGWNEPFTAQTRGTAIRRIAMGIKDNPMLQQYSEDFAIYETGMFDEMTGRTIGHADPIHVIDIADLVAELEHKNETIETTPQLGVA